MLLSDEDEQVHGADGGETDANQMLQDADGQDCCPIDAWLQNCDIATCAIVFAVFFAIFVIFVTLLILYFPAEPPPFTSTTDHMQVESFTTAVTQEGDNGE